MIDSKYVNEENNEKHLLLDRNNIKTESYVIVDKQTEDRPDLISLILCNDMSDMDIFANFNGIIDLFDIKDGTVLEVPNMTDYYANVQYFDIPKTDPLNNNDIDVNIVGENIKNTTNKSPIAKTSVRSNYTVGDNGVFIF